MRGLINLFFSGEIALTIKKDLIQIEFDFLVSSFLNATQLVNILIIYFFRIMYFHTKMNSEEQSAMFLKLHH